MDTTNNNQPERVATTGAQAAERRQHRATRLGAHESTRAARLVEVTGQDRNAAHEWLATYEPADLDDKTWKAVRGFVLECAGQLIDEHQISHQALRRKHVRALTKLARYCRSTHQELNVKTALDPYTVNQFAATVEPDLPRSERPNSHEGQNQRVPDPGTMPVRPSHEPCSERGRKR